MPVSRHPLGDGEPSGPVMVYIHRGVPLSAIRPNRLAARRLLRRLSCTGNFRKGCKETTMPSEGQTRSKRFWTCARAAIIGYVVFAGTVFVIGVVLFQQTSVAAASVIILYLLAYAFPLVCAVVAIVAIIRAVAHASRHHRSS
jgi:hypothetical protein